MQRILSEETWQSLQNDIEQLLELSESLKQANQQLREEKQQLLHIISTAETRLAPVLDQLLSQQEEPA
jgi:hypothetical protein